MDENYISFHISDQNSVWFPWFLFCSVKCKYIHKLNLTKPHAENKYAISHWTNNILHPHPPIFFVQGATVSTGRRPHHHRGFTFTLKDTPQSVGLLWTSDHPTAQTSTWQHTTLTSDRHPCPQRD
jgi:hypothetical protein